MPIYERLDEHGQVAERVQAYDNSHEDNRLGLAAEDPKQPWRVADKPKPEPQEDAHIPASQSSDSEPEAKKKR